MIKHFTKLASMKKERLFDYLLEIVKTRYKNVLYNRENLSGWIIAQGKPNICLCAHMDTVSDNPPTQFTITKTTISVFGSGVLGADDRAGITAILEIIKNLPDDKLPSIIFTDGEESGCIGSYNLVNKFPVCPLKGIELFIGLDRKGGSDYVDYSYLNPKTVDRFFKSYGYNKAIGSFSDVKVFTEAWFIPHGNLSIGYMFEHSMNEYLVLKDFYNTIEQVNKICLDCF